MKLFKKTLFLFFLLLTGCSSYITTQEANEIALREFNSKASNYTVETSEVYNVSESGDHILCYKVVFLDSEMVPISTYILSKKDGTIIKEYHR